MSNCVERIHFKEQPAIRVTAPDGAQAIVLLHGAHVVSWVPAGGQEWLYLSDKSAYGPGTAVRGGIPVCFPQYGTRGALPNHGFARISAWEVADSREGADFAAVSLKLTDSEATRASAWPHRFEIRLEVFVSGRRLDLEFTAHNPGEEPIRFTFALHSYQRVTDISKVRLEGLQGLRYFDSLKGADAEERATELAITDETNRIYFGATAPRRLSEPHRALDIIGENLPDVVVWNPWEKTAANIGDLPDEDYRHMVCVEVAAVETPVELAAGAQWRGLQRFVAR
jgi:glucose-6-phosphate 1-epimerase